METYKDAFGGTDRNIDMHDGKSGGLERMVQREIAQQVADVLRNI